ncbi:uncharacterized protein [Macaca fascicularis]|uniref:uncharacterized protein n=1 Tax=Macaca fascicularis TaxID=9541 RepID=UPI0032B07264
MDSFPKVLCTRMLDGLHFQTVLAFSQDVCIEKDISQQQFGPGDYLMPVVLAAQKGKKDLQQASLGALLCTRNCTLLASEATGDVGLFLLVGVDRPSPRPAKSSSSPGRYQFSKIGAGVIPILQMRKPPLSQTSSSRVKGEFKADVKLEEPVCFTTVQLAEGVCIFYSPTHKPTSKSLGGAGPELVAALALVRLGHRRRLLGPLFRRTSLKELGGSGDAEDAAPERQVAAPAKRWSPQSTRRPRSSFSPTHSNAARGPFLERSKGREGSLQCPGSGFNLTFSMYEKTSHLDSLCLGFPRWRAGLSLLETDLLLEPSQQELPLDFRCLGASGVVGQKEKVERVFPEAGSHRGGQGSGPLGVPLWILLDPEPSGSPEELFETS